MRAAARRLTGRHDFRAFSAFNRVAAENTVRHLRRLEVTGRGARLRITAEADGYLYKMVRSLVGALVAVGRESSRRRRSRRSCARRTARTRSRRRQPRGLFLARVLSGRVLIKCALRTHGGRATVPAWIQNGADGATPSRPSERSAPCAINQDAVSG